MSTRPLVTVVLPCFDVERTVAWTLDSLLAQTHRFLEIVAIDDGSMDATAEILDRYAARDPRVRVLRNDVNRGLIFTLNRGVAEAKGDFIARMDADSISAQVRLERQVDAFTRRPDIGVVGTQVELVDLESRRAVKPRPVRCTEPGAARFMCLFANPLAHVTIMARTEILRAHPYGTFAHSLHTEDYELFTRLSEAGVRFLNLRETLVTVGDRPEGVSWRHEQAQVANFVASARRHLERSAHVSPGVGAHKVLVNRIDATVTAQDLRDGLRLLSWLEHMSLAADPDGAGEVRGVAELQRVDILVQAALKAAPAVRIAVMPLVVQYRRGLMSRRSRQYLASKLPRRATPTGPNSRTGSSAACDGSPPRRWQDPGATPVG
jgi:glycosyltransferase involved in cell wall biosynthesis